MAPALTSDSPPRSMRLLRRRTSGVAVVLLAFLVLGYGALLVWFRFNEDALLFNPDSGPVAPAAESLHLDARDVTFPGADSVTLTARLIPPPGDSAARERATWILYFHGAGGNVGTPGYNKAWARFRHLGLGVLAVDYRGYGKSAGTPSEAGFYRDAEAAHRYLTGQLGVAPSRVVIYGYSLGSAVAIDAATRLPAAGLIVEGAFLSVPARGAELYPYVPVRWLARNRFDSESKIAQVRMPKLLLHARGDTIVPIRHGRQLFALAQPPKTFQDVAGGHTDAYQVDPLFFAAVARFLAGLGLR
jgi:uncharacterized protein